MKILLAENIRFFRKASGLTQEQLAEAMGVTVGAVSKWESGATTPDLSSILELAAPESDAAAPKISLAPSPSFHAP